MMFSIRSINFERNKYHETLNYFDFNLQFQWVNSMKSSNPIHQL